MQLPGKNKKKNEPLPLYPQTWCILGYTSILTALCVSLCKSKSLYHKNLDEWIPQIQSRVYAESPSHVCVVHLPNFWQRVASNFSFSTLPHLPTFTYSYWR